MNEIIVTLAELDEAGDVVGRHKVAIERDVPNPEINYREWLTSCLGGLSEEASALLIARGGGAPEPKSLFLTDVQLAGVETRPYVALIIDNLGEGELTEVTSHSAHAYEAHMRAVISTVWLNLRYSIDPVDDHPRMLIDRYVEEMRGQPVHKPALQEQTAKGIHANIEKLQTLANAHLSDAEFKKRATAMVRNMQENAAMDDPGLVLLDRPQFKR